MECFQVIKTVLDEVCSDIPGSENEKDKLINERLGYLKASYADLMNPNRKRLDYRDPATRFAYIYRYVTSHADMVCRRIKRCAELGELFKTDWVDVTCVGGGPGSDFLGILKYMMSVDSKTTLKCYLFDHEQAWNESWSDVDKKVQGCAFRISTAFQQFDVLQQETWELQKKSLQSDLFTMVYFLSEVWTLRDGAEPFFNNLFASAKTGALFLFIDNDHEAFYGWFDKLAAENGVEPIESEETSEQVGVDEDKEDLGEYYKKFGYPKLTAKIAYRICVKK